MQFRNFGEDLALCIGIFACTQGHLDPKDPPPPLPVPDSTTEPKRGEYMHSAIIPKDWKVGIASQNNLLICSPIITA